MRPSAAERHSQSTPGFGEVGPHQQVCVQPERGGMYAAIATAEKRKATIQQVGTMSETQPSEGLAFFGIWSLRAQTMYVEKGGQQNHSATSSFMSNPGCLSLAPNRGHIRNLKSILRATALFMAIL